MPVLKNKKQYLILEPNDSDLLSSETEIKIPTAIILNDSNNTRIKIPQLYTAHNAYNYLYMHQRFEYNKAFSYQKFVQVLEIQIQEKSQTAFEIYILNHFVRAIKEIYDNLKPEHKNITSEYAARNCPSEFNHNSYNRNGSHYRDNFSLNFYKQSNKEETYLCIDLPYIYYGKCIVKYYIASKKFVFDFNYKFDTNFNGENYQQEINKANTDINDLLSFRDKAIVPAMTKLNLATKYSIV